MKILITGGAGFIGSNFIHYWLKKNSNDQIVNLDKLTYAGNLANLNEVSNNPNYSFVKGDICNGRLVNELMDGVDTVIHFAAESHVDRSVLGPQVFIKTNVVGTQILLDAALKNKVTHFHHISTDEVYGALQLETKNKFDEEYPFRPNSPYAASKAGSDHLVRAYFKTFNLPVTITNCSNNFGPYQFPEKLIPLAITNLIEGKKIPIYGDGLYVRDWLYVEDHCRAIELVIKKGKKGDTYCVGGSKDGVSNLEMIKKICQLMEKNFEESIEFVKDRPGHDRRYAIEWSKIKKELDWEPLFSFDKALKRTVDWYLKNSEWWKRIKNGSYRRYYSKQYKILRV